MPPPPEIASVTTEPETKLPYWSTTVTEMAPIDVPTVVVPRSVATAAVMVTGKPVLAVAVKSVTADPPAAVAVST